MNNNQNNQKKQKERSRSMSKKVMKGMIAGATLVSPLLPYADVVASAAVIGGGGTVTTPTITATSNTVSDGLGNSYVLKALSDLSIQVFKNGVLIDTEENVVTGSYIIDSISATLPNKSTISYTYVYEGRLNGSFYNGSGTVSVVMPNPSTPIVEQTPALNGYSLVATNEGNSTLLSLYLDGTFVKPLYDANYDAGQNFKITEAQTSRITYTYTNDALQTVTKIVVPTAVVSNALSNGGNSYKLYATDRNLFVYKNNDFYKEYIDFFPSGYNPSSITATSISGNKMNFSYVNSGTTYTSSAQIEDDVQGPTISLSLANSNPTNQNVTVNANISDSSGVSVQKWASGSQSASYFASSGTTFTGSTFSISANGTYTVYAKDSIGNESVKTITVSNIDKTAPSTPTLSASTTSPTNGNVSVTISYPADANVKEYRVNGGSWTTYSSAVTMTANGTVEARATDSAGNVSSIGSMNVNNIDKTAPSISLTPSTTSPTNKNVNVTVATSDAGSGVSTVKYASGSQSASYFASSGTAVSGGVFSVSANGTYTVYAEDDAGNGTVKTIAVSNIDKSAPSAPTFASSNTAWTNQNVTVTITYPSDSAIDEYSLDGGTTWKTYSSAITMTANGTVKARATDSAGNVSAVGSLTVSNIDKSVPAITLSPSTTSATNQNVSVTVGTTSESGVAVMEWASGSQTASYFATGGTTVSSNVFSVSANGTYTVYVKDNAGNESVKTITVSNIDKTAPTTPTLSPSTTAWTNQNVTVTITYPSDSIKDEYSLDGGSTWQVYSSALSLSANGTVKARGTDNAGNVSSVGSLTVSNIDKVAPSITLTPSTTSPTNQNVNVNVSSTSTSGIATTKWASGTQTASYFASAGTTVSSNVFSVSANGTYTVYTKDNAGNESVKTITVSNIDKTAPTTPTLTSSTTAWTNGNVTVTITYPSDSTIDEYSVDNGTTWQVYSAPITMTANGTVKARGTDNAGNVSSVGSLTISNIDKVAPVITLSPNTTSPTNQNVSVSVSSSSTSGVSTLKYASGSQTASYFATSGTAVSNNAFSVSANGTYTVYAKDNAGNESVKTITVSNIDKVAPSTPTLTPSTTSWTNGNVSVTITYPSDSVENEYSVDNGSTWQTYSSPISISANGTVKARATDNAGNVSAVGSLTVSNIDKVVPTISLTPSTTSPTNQNVSVTVSASSTSGVATLEYATGIQTASYFATAGTVISGNVFSVSANGTYTVYVKDNAGNESVQTITVSNIDKVEPTAPTFTASTTSPTNGTVSVTINYPLDAFVKEYSLDNGTTWATYSSAIVMTANGTIQARATDNAGNVSTVSNYSVNNIDKTAPSLTVTPSTTSPTNVPIVMTVSASDASGISTTKWASGSQSASYFASSGTVLSGNSFSVTANGTYTVYTKDQAGNEVVQTVTVSNYDVTPPTAPSISIDTTPTNGNVTVTISYPSDAFVKEYSLDNGTTWQTYSTPFAVSSNGTIKARATDNAGNVSVISSLTVSNIDKTAPSLSITPSTTNPTNQPIGMTVNATDSESGILVSKWANGSQTTSYFATGGTALSGNTFTVSANGTYTVYTKDKAGNETVKTITVSNYDVNPPVSATFSASTTSSTNGNVTLTIAYPSDANVKEYKIGSNGTWTAYTSALTITANNTIYARSTDSAGNVSAESNYTVANIDKTAPSLSLAPSTVEPTNQDVIVTVTATDNESGVSVKKYASGTQTASYFATGGTALSGNTFTVSANGTYTVYTKDVAGNETVQTLTVSNIDKVAPANATLTTSTTAWTNQSVTVTIAYPSDAVTKEYKVGSTGIWTTYTSPVVVSSNNTVYARSTDNADNMSAESNLTVSNIDKVAPSVSLSPSTNSPTNADVTVTLNVSDALSGISVKKYASGNQTASYFASAGTSLSGNTFAVSANGTYTVYAKDNSGNETVQTITISNIDKVAPADPTFALSNTNPTNTNVIVTISYPSDAVTKEYSLNGGAWQPYTTALSLSDNGKVQARATDNAGNVTVSSVNVSNIDKIEPQTPTISADQSASTNQDVTMTIAYPSDAVSKEVRINGGAWTLYSSSFKMTANGVVEARAIDNAGNVSSIVSYTVSNIDKTPPTSPTVSVDQTAPTNGKVTVSATFPSDSVLNEVRVNGGSWTAYSTGIVFSANGTVDFRAKDQAGNYSSVSSYTVSNIDTVAPTTPTLNPSTTATTNGNVTVTVSYPSDANVKEVRVNGGLWTVYTSAVVMTANGTVEARATDMAGNVSSLGSLSVSNIDKVPPTTPTLSADVNTPTNQPVKVSVSYPSDTVVKEVRVNGGTWQSYSSAIVMNANGLVEARATDQAGNTSSVGSFTVSNIDTVAPNAPTVSADKNSPTNTDVSLTVSFPSDAVVKEVRVNGGVWVSYSNPIVFSTNGTLEARAKDDAGNYSTVTSYSVTNIDKVAPVDPTLVADKNAPTNQNVNVTISYSADSTTRQYKVGSNGTWQNYTSPVIVSSNDTVYARGYDAVGNGSKEVSFDVTNIDKTAPTSPVISVDKNEPTNTDVTVSVTYPNDAFVKEVKVGTNGTWVTYSAPVVVSANTQVFARATDNAGNVSAESSVTINNIDKVAPTTPTLVVDKLMPTNMDVTVTATFPTDAYVKQVKVGNGSWQNYTAPIVLSSNDTVYVKAQDQAGNWSAEASYVVSNIDKVAPNAPILKPSTINPTNTDVTVEVTYPSDVAVKEVKVGLNGTWQTYTAPIVLSANDKVFARGTDNAGNVSTVSVLDVTNIDKIAPANPSVTLSTYNPTNQDVTVSIGYSSDSVTKQYRVGSTGTWTNYGSPFQVSSNTTVYVRAVDNAGNETQISQVVSSIDKVAPETPTLAVDKSQPTNTNVTVTATFPTDAYVKQVKVGNGSWQTYAGSVVLSQNDTVYVKAQDEAGNWSATASLTVSNIDKIAPVEATFTASITSPTNQDVTVSVQYPTDGVVKEVKMGNGSWKSYTAPVVVSSNTIVYARSTDQAGNVSNVTSYTVNNIDKVAPNSPSVTLSPTSNEMIITDNNSDKQTVEYQVNGGAWTVYNGKVTFKDGSYSVNARTTDTAGNTSLNASVSVVVYGEQLVVANQSVDTALSSQLQTDVDKAKGEVAKLPSSAPEKATLQTKLNSLQQFVTARTAVEVAEQEVIMDKVNIAKPLVNSLPDSTQKQSLANRLQLVESYINLRTQATDAVVKAEGSKTQADVNSARTLVNQLRDSDKAPLSSRLDAVQSYLDYQTLLTNAQNSVSKAEATKVQADVDSATVLVNQLQDGAIKVSLQNRLYVVQQDINAQLSSQSNGGATTVDLSPTELARLETQAKEAVSYAESLKTQTSISDAMDLVLSLPDSSTVKSDLLARLQVLQDEQDNKQETSMNAYDLVQEALRTLDPNDYATAKSAVDAMPNNSLRFDLLSQLSIVQYGIELSKETNPDILLLKVNNAVKSAELYKRDPYVGKAKVAVDFLPDGMPEKADLEKRLASLYVAVQQAKYQSNLSSAQSKVTSAEKYKTASSIQSAFDATMLLPQGADRDGLLARLNAISGGVPLEQYALSKQIELATKYVTQAEKYPSTYRISLAYKKVNALADTVLQKMDLLSRMKTVELVYNSTMAERYVGYAEKYKSPYFVKKAKDFISKMTDETKKSDLTNRLNVIESNILQSMIDEATLFVQKAETNTSTNLFYLDMAKEKVAKLPDTAPEKASLLERIQVVENPTN